MQTITTANACSKIGGKLTKLTTNMIFNVERKNIDKRLRATHDVGQHVTHITMRICVRNIIINEENYQEHAVIAHEAV